MTPGRSTLLFLTLLVLPVPVVAQVDTAGLRIRDSLEEAPWLLFQRAVLHNDTAAVIAMVHFPLRVNSRGHRPRFVTNPGQFRKEYAHILPTSYQALIARLPFDSLITSWRGTMTPRGELWFDNACPDDAQPNCDLTRRLVAVNLETP